MSVDSTMLASAGICALVWTLSSEPSAARFRCASRLMFAVCAWPLPAGAMLEGFAGASMSEASPIDCASFTTSWAICSAITVSRPMHCDRVSIRVQVVSGRQCPRWREASGAHLTYCQGVEAATREQLALLPKRRGLGRGVEESLRFRETQVKMPAIDQPG